MYFIRRNENKRMQELWVEWRCRDLYVHLKLLGAILEKVTKIFIIVSVAISTEI